MANLETLSRPYAQALFEHSGGWSEDLDQITQVVSMPGVSNLIDSPHLSYQEKVEKFLLLLEGEVQDKTLNFLRVLSSTDSWLNHKKKKRRLSFFLLMSFLENKPKVYRRH
jgi:F0F1-type ATP synthase delta subunit